MRKQTMGIGILCTLLLVNLGVGLHLHSEETKRESMEDAFKQIDVLMEVIQLVRNHYVDADKAKVEELLEGAIHGITRTLDPFSNYLEPAQQQQLHEETEGEFGGIGIQIDFEEKYLVIIAPIDGTPAHAAGLQPGDMVLKVNGEDVEKLGLDNTIEKMRGKPGTTVTITYMRDGFDKPRDLVLTRAMIPIHSVTKASIRDGIGYVRITQFMEKTADDLEKVLKDTFSSKGLKGLIIDLRSNPGGLLNSAVDICSYFLPEGTFVVSVEGRKNAHVQNAEGGYKFRQDIPIVLLVDKGSASAAEIMAGCLKTHGRVVLVGEKTFGKGSVQNVIPLTNGRELKLTIAHYFVQPKETPNRQTIHKNGIKPDVEVSYTDKELKALEKAFDAFDKAQKNPKLTEKQRIQRRETFFEAREREDKVYRTAVDVILGKITPKKQKAPKQDAGKKAQGKAKPKQEAKPTK